MCHPLAETTLLMKNLLEHFDSLECEVKTIQENKAQRNWYTYPIAGAYGCGA